MHRNDRLTGIVVTLRTNARTTAEQLAHQFSVGARTIYRDIALLHRMGVPVVGETGVGYSIDPDMDIGAVALTAGEASALFECARAALGAADTRTTPVVLAAMGKLKQILPDVLVEALEQEVSNAG